MYNRDFKGVWIPKEIWLNKDLTFLDKVIFTEIDSLDTEQHCLAGNDYLAEFCQCSERKVSESIKKLCDLGFIELVSFDGRRRVLKSTFAKQGRKNCEADSQNLQSNNIDNNIIEDIIPINSNNIGKTSEYDSHGYSPEELRESFLGSAPKKKKVKRPSLYDKCVDEILCYTKNLSLQDKLLDYLAIRLKMENKPIYGVNQWKGLLNRLSEVSGESALDKSAETRIKIVEQSIERGWASFFELKYSGQYRNDCAAFGTNDDRVVCEPDTNSAEERKAKLEKQGKRSSF